MTIQHSAFVGDVAIIYSTGAGDSYGSGRLVAPGLVLTAAHLIQDEDGSACLERDWNVLLLGELQPGADWESPYKSRVVWTGKDGLDMALLQIYPGITVKPLPRPTIEPIYVSYDDVRSLEVRATGFPEAWRDEHKTRDLTVPGTLWVSTRDGPYTWNALLRPDRRDGWKGMSGAVVCLPSRDGRIHLFGVVQQVPTNFSQGTLDVARASLAIADQAFCSLLTESTGVPASVVPFSIGEVVSAGALTLRSSFPAFVEGTSGKVRIKLEAFLAEYLLRPSAPLKFLGRSSEFECLDSWLASAGAPYFALVGPAGRGKSALAVQWAAKVSERGQHNVVILPISVRFDLARPDELLKLLAIRLRYLVGKNLELDNFSADRLIDEIHAILGADQISISKPLLIIIDGWDEAQDPKWLLFPQLPGKGVKVLVSSRLLVNELQVKDASRRMGVPASDAGLLLSPLSKRDLIEGSHDLEDWIPGVVDWLWHHSGGDPLLVRLYLDWISDRKEKGEILLQLTPDRVEVGLARYMRIWWDEIQAGAGTAGIAHVKCLLHALALARGPLSAEDMMELTGVDPLDIASAWGPLRRLIVGNGLNVGYSFNHPRIGQFVAEELMTARARAAMEERYFDWCVATARALKEETHPQTSVSSYVLSFCIDHFETQNAMPVDYTILFSAGWMRARHSLDGHYSAFVADLLRIHAIALRNDFIELGAGCALAKSIVVALSNAIPPGLLRMAIDEGLITGIQAIEEISTIRSPRARAVAISAVADRLDESASLRAADIAWNITQQEERILALAALAGQMLSCRDAFTADIEYEQQPETVTALLLLRTAFAKLGYLNSAILTEVQQSQLNDELRQRIWAMSNLDNYILWARETAQVLDGEARDIFVVWIANSVKHREYKWAEHKHLSQLICALAQYLPSDTLTNLESLLDDVDSSAREARANLLARRISLGLVDRAVPMSEVLDGNNPWSCVSLLPHMNKASAQQWAQQCLLAAEAYYPETRWPDILRCLPYTGTGNFIKHAWRQMRKVEAPNSVCELARAILPKMTQSYRVHAADRFLERLNGFFISNSSNIAIVAAIAREASPESLRSVRKFIDPSQEGLLIIFPRLDPNERRRLMTSVLNETYFQPSLYPVLSECFKVLPTHERTDLARACLDRMTGSAQAWSSNRRSSLIQAELIEAFAPHIVSILGIETISVLRRVAEGFVTSTHRALALSTLAGCSSGHNALELAVAALIAYITSDKEDDRLWGVSTTFDVRAALSILSDCKIENLFASDQELQNVARLIDKFRDEQATSIGAQVSCYWDSGDRDEIVRLFESLCSPLSYKIHELFLTLGRLIPILDKWLRQLWARGMEAAAADGYQSTLSYIAMSAPCIDAVLDDHELNKVVEVILDVPFWEWQ